jgi:DNA polymerase III subunit gamma/tau
MENFIVSARKYRPATFDTVVGQASITTTLKNAIKNNHLAQAFLFCGPRGVGKTTCARILAKTINCFNIAENIEACDKCESCVSFNSGHSLNVYELDAASNNSVDDIRNLVDQVRFAPQLGKYKVYIIDEVHMLSSNAFNAFLKTLEEPPKHAIFILATTERHKIIPTILSRCQIFDFNRIRIDDIATHLAFIAKNEGIAYEEDALHVIAQKADGALRDACSIFDQIVSFAGNNVTYKAVIENLNILDYDYYFKATDQILEGNISQILLLFNEVLNNGFDGHNFINGLAGHFRNLLVCKDTSTLELLEVSSGIKDKYKEQSQKCPMQFLLRGLGLLSKCDLEYKGSKNQRLLVELALMQLCSMNSAGPEKKNDELKAEPIQEKKTDIKPEIKPIPTVSAATAPSNFSSPKLQPAPVSEPVTIKKPVIKTSSPTLSSVIEPPKITAAAEPSIPLKPADPMGGMKENFTLEQLETVWKTFAKKVNEDGKMQLFATLTAQPLVLKEDFTIELTISNKSQEELIDNEKTILLTYLRKELKNGAISLVTILNKDLKPARPYTPQDKFKHMADKNPNINKLKQEFDLEIDF